MWASMGGKKATVGKQRVFPCHTYKECLQGRIQCSQKNLWLFHNILLGSFAQEQVYSSSESIIPNLSFYHIYHLYRYKLLYTRRTAFIHAVMSLYSSWMILLSGLLLTRRSAQQSPNQWTPSFHPHSILLVDVTSPSQPSIWSEPMTVLFPTVLYHAG